MKKQILGFFNEYRFLSNFFDSPISHMGVCFPTVEHAYQASKSTSMTTFKSFAECRKPAEAKTKGKRIKCREDWDDVKLPIMRSLIHKKFQIPRLRNMLLDTEDAVLIEYNTWGDTFWGQIILDGVLTGENKLGIILMNERDNILKGII